MLITMSGALRAVQPQQERAQQQQHFRVAHLVGLLLWSGKLTTAGEGKPATPALASAGVGVGKTVLRELIFQSGRRLNVCPQRGERG